MEAVSRPGGQCLELWRIIFCVVLSWNFSNPDDTIEPVNLSMPKIASAATWSQVGMIIKLVKEKIVVKRLKV